jgi:hypothetical protein
VAARSPRAIRSRRHSIPDEASFTTTVSAYRSATSPGSPSPSALIRRTASVSARRGSCSRLRTAAAMRFSRRSSAGGSFPKHSRRSRIVERGERCPNPSVSPCADRTRASAPGSASGTTRAMAPESTQGWRRRSERSRPGLRTTSITGARVGQSGTLARDGSTRGDSSRPAGAGGGEWVVGAGSLRRRGRRRLGCVAQGPFQRL